MTRFLQGITALAAFVVCTAAHGGPVTVQVTFGQPPFGSLGSEEIGIRFPTANHPSQYTSETVFVGRLEGNGSNLVGASPSIFVDSLDDIYMYCYDLYQSVSGGLTVNYTINFAGPTARTLNFLGAVNYVLSGYTNTWTDPWAWLHPTDLNQAVAIQLGIWESRYETSSTWALGLGSFRASGVDTDTGLWITRFFAAVNNAAVNDLPAGFAMTLESPRAQDMLTGDPPPTNVPAPGSLALVAVALGALSLARSRSMRRMTRD